MTELAATMQSSETSSALVRAGRLFVIFMGPSLGGLAPLALSIDQIALAEHFGGGKEGALAASILFPAPSLTIMLGAPLAGYLAERIGYRPVLLVSLLLYGLAGPAGLLLDGYWPLLISRLLLGLAGGGMMAMYMALAATFYEGEARARVIGFAVACSALVGLLGLQFGGILVDAQGWRGPFWLYFIGLVTFAVAWATVRGRIDAASRSAARASPSETLKVIARLWPVYLVLFTLSIGTFTATSGGPFLLKANGIDSAALQGLLLALGAVPAMITGSAYGYLRRWSGDYALLIATGLIMGTGVLLLVTLHGAVAVVATMVLLSLGAGFKAPTVATVLMAEATPTTRGAVAGLNSSGIFLAQFVTPQLLRILGDQFGMKGGCIAIGTALLAIAVFVALRGIGRQREEVYA
jgi:predicted MFS family arabinose efflux permease